MNSSHSKNMKNLKDICMFSKMYGGVSDYKNLMGFMGMLKGMGVQQGGDPPTSSRGYYGSYGSNSVFTTPYYNGESNGESIGDRNGYNYNYNNDIENQYVQNDGFPTQTIPQEQVPQPIPQYPPMPSNQISTFTIPAGTILYHATTKRKGFNTQYMELGNDKLILFFSPNFRLASDKIEGCSLDKQNGFIHVFRVVRDIPNIYVKLPYDLSDDTDMDMLENNFCSGTNKFSGVGFFYPKSNIEMFSDPNIVSNASMSNYQNQSFPPTQYQYQYQNQYQPNPTPTFNFENYYAEFGLCNPKSYLEYVYSQKCQSLKKLSDPYRFDS